MSFSKFFYSQILFLLIKNISSVGVNVHVIHYPPYTNCDQDEISNTPMGQEVELIRSAATSESLTEGTDYDFTCHGADRTTLVDKIRKTLFETIMVNQTDPFIVVGGIPLTENYVRNYEFSYMTYESTLIGIYMPDAANQMFYFESGFQAVYYMIIISIVGIGTFITIYEYFQTVEEKDGKARESIVDEWFKNTWLSYLLMFNFNHKLYFKLPSRILAIFSKVCAMFVFALYIGFIFKKMHKTFVYDSDLSQQLGKRAQYESIYSPWMYNLDYNIVSDSPYNIQENISKKAGWSMVLNEFWFLRRNSSDVCGWHYALREFGGVQYALWTTSAYSSNAVFTKIDTGIQAIRANTTFMRNQEDTYFPLNYTCTLFPDYRILKSLVVGKRVIQGNEYFLGEYLLILCVALAAGIMGVFMNKAKSYYEKRKKIQKTKKFLNSAESVILRKTEVFFDKHREESLQIVLYLENNLMESFHLKTKIDKMITKILSRNDKLAKSLNARGVKY